MQTPKYLVYARVNEKELLLDQSPYLHRALHVAGLDAAFHIIEGAGHGFQRAREAQQAEIGGLLESATWPRLPPRRQGPGQCGRRGRG
jgi:acetyl esterase/lipase